MTKRRAVIFVHGVGPAKDGEVLTSFLSGEVPNEASSSGDTQELLSGLMSGRAISGDTYPSLKLTDGLELVESGWSEFRPVRRNTFTTFLEMLALLWGMLKLATYDKFDVGSIDRKINRLGTLYFWSFVALLFWCIHPAILSLFLMTGDYSAYFLWIGALGSVVWLLSKYDRVFRFGAAWIVSSLVLGASVWFGWFGLTPSIYVSISAYAYIAAQIATVTIGWLFMVGQVGRFSSDEIKAQAARLAIAFLPFFAASGVGALVWTLALARANSIQVDLTSLMTFDEWADVYGQAMLYPVFNAEMYNGLSMFIIGCLLVFPALWVFVRGKARVNGKVAIATRKIFSKCLFVSGGLVLVLIPLFPLTMLVLPDMSPGVFANQGMGTSTFAAYATWATRVLPFLPLFFGGFAIVLKIVGDIVFYLLPPSDQVEARSKAVLKLKKLIRNLLTEDHTVLVISHSQGTMVALDTVEELAAEGTALDRFGLWLSGSPSIALYHDFLGLDRIKGQLPKHLKNYFRSDDVIAGSIQDAVSRRSDSEELNFVETAWGAGGHINYWKDFDIREIRAAFLRIEGAV